ncbi:SIMPL domain-containing protein [Sedimentitalea sp. HM32M-2]|uniref:SIMPL domain-containing protein n=1 Tax=Sedimentitalea sp. HM32M-2 TaxID=3351566 RepID=UPI003631E4D7
MRQGMRAMVAATVTSLALTGVAWADPAERQITVTAQGQVEAVPDMATITLGVTHEAEEAGTAMAATSAAVARMLEQVQGLGIQPRDVQTRRFSVHPIWSGRGSSGSEPPRITGFVASNMVMVRIRDLLALGPVLDAVIASGANDFNGLQFSVQEPQALQDAARKAAVENAIAQARLLAESAGVALGPVVSITDHGGNSARPVMMEMAAARDASVPVAAGEVSLTASVSMVFAIAD